MDASRYIWSQRRASRSRWWLWLATAAIVGGAFAGFWYELRESEPAAERTVHRPPQMPPAIPGAGPARPPDQVFPSGGDNRIGAGGGEIGPVRIGPDTEMVYNFHYRETGKTVREVRRPTSDMVNLTLESLRRYYPGYRIEQFTRERVVLAAEVDGPDPETVADERRRFRTIGIRDGYVTIFLGKKRPDQPVKYQTQIPVDMLPQRDREALSSGIVVEGDREVAGYLEGLSE